MGLIWDLAHVNDTFHGGWKKDLLTFAGRATDPISNQSTLTGKSLAPFLKADLWLLSNVVQRPLSTAMIEASHISRGGGFGHWDELFDSSTWSQSYDLAKEQSFGQSFAFAMTNDKDPFNYEHPYAETLHKDHPFLASALSGVADAGISWYLDPLVVAGKAAAAGRVARARPVAGEAERAAVAENLASEERHRVKLGRYGITPFTVKGLKTRTEEVNGYIDDAGDYQKGFIDGKSQSEILKGLSNGPVNLERHPKGMQFANLLSQTNKIADPASRVATRNTIWRVALGDPTAFNDLRKGQEWVGDQLDNIAKGSVTGATDGVVYDALPDARLFPSASKAENIAEAERQLENNPLTPAYLEHAEGWYAKLVGSKGEGGQPGLFASFESIPSVNRGMARSVNKIGGRGLLRSGQANTGYKIADDVLNRTLGRPIEKLYQASPSSMPIRIIHGYTAKSLRGAPVFIDSLSRLRPGGVVNLNDGEEVWRNVDSYLRFLHAPPESYKKYGDMLVRADSPGGRLAAVKAVQEYAAEQIFRKHGLDAADPGAKAVADSVLSKHNRESDALAAALNGRQEVYSATLGENGHRVDQFGEDGATALPFVDTQNASLYAMLPMDELDKTLRRYGSVFRAAARSWHDEKPSSALAGFRNRTSGAATFGAEAKDSLFDTLTPLLDTLNRTWKFSVLLRLGYLQRNVLDDHMRTMAALGTSTAIHGLTEGGEHLAKNLARPGRNYLRAHKLKVAISDLEQHVGTDELYAANQEVYKEIAKITTKLKTVQSERRIRELKARRDTLLANNPDDLSDAKAQLDALRKQFESGEYRAKKARMGLDDEDIRIGDTVITMPGEFSGPYGDAFRAMNSTQSYEEMGEVSAAFRQASASRSASYEVITPLTHNEDYHLAQWEYVVNHHLIPSEVAKPALEGGDEAVKAFLKTSRGREIRRELSWHSDPDRWAHDVSKMVDEYLPTEGLREIAKKRKVTIEDLKREIPDAHERPAVHGAAADMTFANGRASHFFNSTLSGFYKWVGKRNDTLSRHPVFHTLYRSEFKRLSEARVQAASHAGEKLTTADAEKIAHSARLHAKSEVSKILFDLAGTTEVAHYMRFVAPFFGAWQEGLARWWNIVKADPSVARRFFMIFDVPRELGIEIDTETGELVKPGEAIKDSHRILFQMPEAWGGPSPTSKNGKPGYQSPIGVSEASFNMITQGGGLFNPGFGPFIQLPVNQLAISQADDPETEKKVRAILPMGTVADVKSMFVPGVARYGLTVAGAKFFDHYSTQYKQMQSLTLQNMLVKWGQEHSRPDGSVRWPTETEMNKMIADSKSQTISMGALKFASAALSPAALQIQGEFAPQLWAYRHLVDQAQAEDRPAFWADKKFIDQYGEAYFPLTQSASLNHAGLYSTVGTISSIKAHRGTLDKIDPSLYRMAIGAEGEGTYDQTSRNYLYTHQLQPGSGDSFITAADPRTAMENAITAAGWEAYSKFMDRLQLESQRRGYDSFVNDPQMAVRKKAGIDRLAAQNPTWFQEYSTHNDAAYEAKLEGMEVIVQEIGSDPRRTDVQMLGSYLALRAQIQQILEARAQHGGSSSPEATANRDVLTVFTNQVAKMVEANTAFQSYMLPTIDHDPYLLDSAVIDQAIAA